MTREVSLVVLQRHRWVDCTEHLPEHTKRRMCRSLHAADSGIALLFPRNKPVIVGVMSDPEPLQPVGVICGESSVMKAHPYRMEPPYLL
jgi:hypothetical protein